MLPIALISLFLRASALAWSLALWRKLRDRRVGLFAALFAVLLVRQALSMSGLVGFRPGLELLGAEIASLIVSILTISCLIAVGRMLGERDAASAELARSRSRVQREYAELRAIYDNAHVGMCTVGPDLRYITINERLARINGLPVQEHLGRTIREIIPHLADQLEPTYRSVLETGQPSVNVEFTGIAPAGSEEKRDWAVTHYPITDERGRVVAVGCTVADISEQKRAVGELQASEQRQRALLQAVPDAMFRMRSDGTYLAYHAPDGQQLLVRPEDFLGRKTQDVLPPDLARKCMDAIHRTLQTGQMQTYEYESLRAGEERVTYEVRVVVSGPDEVLLLVRNVTERRRAEESLRASEDRYRTLIETTRTGYAVVDLDGRVLEANDQYVRLSGHERFDQIAGRRFSEWTAPHDRDRNNEAFRQCIDQGSTVAFEKDYIRPSGGFLPVEINATALNTPEGIRICVLCRDISDRRAAASALRESEHRLRQIVGAIPQIVWTCDADGGNHVFNNRWAQYTGIETTTFATDEWLQAAHPSDRDRIRETWARAASSGAPAEIEYRLRRADGEYRWHLDRGVPLSDESGRTVRWFGTCTDIHDLRQAREQLAASSAELERAQAVAHVGSWVSDPSPDGHLNWSREACRIFGIERERFDGRVATFLRCVHPDDLAMVEQAARNAIERGAPYDIEHRIVRPDGRTRWVHERADTLRDQTGRAVKMIGTVQDVTERRLADEQLRASEGRFRRIVDSNMIGIVFWNGDLEITEANGEFLRMIGCTREELLGRRISSPALTPPEYAALDHQALAEITRHGACASFEKEFIRKDGSRFPALVGGARLDESGRSGVSFVIDLSGQRRAESERHAAERRFRALFEQSPDGIAIIDPVSGRITDANAALKRMIGHSTEEPLDATVGELGAMLSPEDIRVRIEEVLRRGHGEAETRLRTRSGAMIDVSVRAHAVDLPGGPRIHTIIRDITEAKLAAERLREAQQRSALLIRQTPLAVIIWDVDGRVVEWNPAAERVFGYTAEEARGRLFDQLILPAPLIPYVRDLWARLLSAAGGSRSTNENITKDGRTITCEWYNSSLVDAQGRVIGVASVSEDVTERRRLEEELRRAQKMEAIGQLASGVAHDFSNLLTAIFGFTSLARRTLSPQHPAVRSLDRVDEAARQAVGVSRALLTFSRGDTSEKKPLRLAQVVEDSLRLLRRTLPANIEVSTSMPRRPVWVRGDATQLQQVVMNLAINARDAMPSGGKLVISVGESTGQSPLAMSAHSTMNGNGHAPERPESAHTAVLSVSDTGIGMSAETRARIFEPFFTTKPPGQGTGLGLAIVHGIINDHGGRIEVQSEPGRGSTFAVHLPAVEPEPEAPRPSSTVPTSIGAGRLVLLADEHRYLREIVASMLESMGFEVAQAATPESLTDLMSANAGRVCALVIDSNLLALTTGKFLDLVRSQDGKIRMIAITGAGQANAPGLGPDAVVLAKPFQMSELAAAVSAALG